MEVAEALENYFDKLLVFWEAQYSTFPTISFEEDIENWMYIGVPDEEERVQWEPKLKTSKEGFLSIEQEIGMKLHNSMKAYFDSYWFLSLEGFYGPHRITLEEVAPNKDIRAFFTNQKSFIESTGEELNYFLIGYFSPDDQALLLDNRTGEIFKEDYETDERMFVSSSWQR